MASFLTSVAFAHKTIFSGITSLDYLVHVFPIISKMQCKKRHNQEAERQIKLAFLETRSAKLTFTCLLRPEAPKLLRVRNSTTIDIAAIDTPTTAGVRLPIIENCLPSSKGGSSMSVKFAMFQVFITSWLSVTFYNCTLLNTLPTYLNNTRVHSSLIFNYAM